MCWNPRLDPAKEPKEVPCEALVKALKESLNQENDNAGSLEQTLGNALCDNLGKILGSMAKGTRVFVVDPK